MTIKTQPTYLVNIHWINREIQTVYVGASSVSEAKTKAVMDCRKSNYGLHDENKTKAVRIYG